MEGKVFRSTGEVNVHDDKGAVNEDKPDTSNREDILSSLFSRNNNRSLFTESFAPTWRWNLYICAIIAGTVTLLALAGLDETHHATIIYRRQTKQGGATVQRKTRKQRRRRKAWC